MTMCHLAVASRNANGPRLKAHPSLLPLALAVGALLSGCGEQTSTAGPSTFAPNQPEVGVVILRPQSVAITAELPGRTAASLVAEVRPQVGGIIQKRLFVEGSEVEDGAPLYQIDPATYEAALTNAEGTLAKAQAAVPAAQARVQRYTVLVDNQNISRQNYDDATLALAQAKAEEAAAEANVKSARINLDYTTIKAPIAGRVDKSTLTQGALVTAGQTVALTTIRTIDPIHVEVTESAASLLRFRKAVADGKIKLTGNGIQVRLKLDDGTFYARTGKFEFAESNVSEATGTYLLRAVFPNPDRLLLPGMFVRAIIENGVAENSFLVPQRAVSRNTKGEPTALFVAADGKVESRTLIVNGSVGNNWLVETGVQNGDRVIVEGLQRTRVGQKAIAVEVSIDETTGEIKERKQRGAGDAVDTPATSKDGRRRADIPAPAGSPATALN